MTRKILFGTLALTPIALLAHYVFHVSDTMTFVLAALALMPLAWLIGEATEHVAEHTGPGIGRRPRRGRPALALPAARDRDGGDDRLPDPVDPRLGR